VEAEQRTSHVGDPYAHGPPGKSMAGVTGREPAFLKSASETTADPSFDLPVDSEHKAKKIKILSIAQPHMRSFHLSWMSFFTAFLSTFAAAPMIPVVRDNLNLDKASLTNAGIAAVVGNIAARIIMGYVCDTYGPRFGHAVLMLGTSPAVYCMSLVTSPIGFIMSRFVIGFGLATFVATQFWSSSMFNGKVVGMANATTAGWGNLGGGVTQFVIPLIYSAFQAYYPDFYAWRCAFFIPGTMHLIVGTAILLFSQDLPDGQYHELKKKGTLETNGAASAKNGMLNYRTWMLTILYGLCFGVELTMNNIIVAYLFDQFDLPLRIAGILGACFGLMNIFARSLGGFTSDLGGNRFGMRGRLWAYWTVQTLEGVMCIAMGFLQYTLAGTLVTMVAFSIFVQMSEGAAYGVVPFVSKRSLGIVSGLVGAGGNAGSAILQALYFKGDVVDVPVYEGIRYMGYTITVLTLLVFTIHFPMWGSMLKGPAREQDGSLSKTEEDYYFSDYTAEEREAGKHLAAAKFAKESKIQRAQVDRLGEEPPTAKA